MTPDGQLLLRVLRFAAVGSAATALHFAVALSLIHALTVAPGPANAAAFLVATAFSYVCNALWSFQAALSSGGLARFFAVASLGLGVSWLIARAADGAGLESVVGVLLVALAIPPVSFAGHFLWTFADRNRARRG